MKVINNLLVGILELGYQTTSHHRDINGGFADSPLRLNRGLQHLKQWNETEINKRAESLADMAVKVWSSPCM